MCPGCSKQTVSLRDKILESLSVRIRCRSCSAALRVSPWWRLVMVVFGASILVLSVMLALDFGSVLPIFVGLVVAFCVGPLAPLSVYGRDSRTRRLLARGAPPAIHGASHPPDGDA